MIEMQGEAGGAIAQQRKRRTALLVIGINVVVTLLTASSLGPAASKLDSLFGLVAWSGRAPFYLMLLYLGPAILLVSPGLLGGAAIGTLLAVPLALWSHAAACPAPVQIGYLASGVVQGALLAWVWRRTPPNDVPPT